MGQGMMVSDMIKGRSSGTSPYPNQTFYAANIAGTTVPRVGNAQAANMASPAGAMAGISPINIAVIVVVLIGAGYILHHFFFEESVRVG
jgi:hypothetical protein